MCIVRTLHSELVGVLSTKGYSQRHIPGDRERTVQFTVVEKEKLCEFTELRSTQPRTKKQIHYLYSFEKNHLLLVTYGTIFAFLKLESLHRI